MSCHRCRKGDNVIQKLGDCGPIPRLEIRVVWRMSRIIQEKRSPEKWYALWSPLRNFLKASFSGWVGLSSVSFHPNADQSHPLFPFGLLPLATSQSSTISLGGITLSRRPLNIRMGNEGGIPAILAADSHFWVVKRLRKRPMGQSRTKWGMELNVFSTMSADICDKMCLWMKNRRKNQWLYFVRVAARDINGDGPAKRLAIDDLLSGKTRWAMIRFQKKRSSVQLDSLKVLDD
jgi:hypothetical protein